MTAALVRLTAQRPPLVTVDLSGLSAISCLVMGVLMAFQHWLVRSGGRVRLGAIEANMLMHIFLIEATVDGMIRRQFGRIVNITSSGVTGRRSSRRPASRSPRAAARPASPPCWRARSVGTT
jgi:hypothetical protein